MNIKKLEQIEGRIYELIPERITVCVLKDGQEIEVSVCEFHRMLHNEEVKCDDMKSEWNHVFTHVGNSLADLEAWFHILRRHMTGMHGELPKEKGTTGSSEYEQHKKLLQDMAEKQTIKIT